MIFTICFMIYAVLFIKMGVFEKKATRSEGLIVLKCGIRYCTNGICCRFDGDCGTLYSAYFTHLTPHRLKVTLFLAR